MLSRFLGAAAGSFAQVPALKVSFVMALAALRTKPKSACTPCIGALGVVLNSVPMTLRVRLLVSFGTRPRPAFIARSPLFSY